jgi:hypothetical protein
MNPIHTSHFVQDFTKMFSKTSTNDSSSVLYNGYKTQPRKHRFYLRLPHEEGAPSHSPTHHHGRATIHASIFSLSTLENNYFEGEITDGVAITRFVGFDRTHFTQMEQKNMTVTLKNCQIKLCKLATSLEAILRNYTSIERSDITFEPNPEMLGTTLLEIANLPTMKYDRATVRVQVIKLADPE